MLNMGKLGTPPLDFKKKVIQYIIDFVFQNLAPWRDESLNGAVESEENLTHALHDYLSDQSHRCENFFFHLEEKQSGRRRIDLSAKPTKILCAQLYQWTKYQALVVFEAKRLPAPEKGRLKEYVTGGGEMTGGIQRFKACEHGAEHDVAAMIGYVQKDNCPCHFNFINKIINSLAEESEDGLHWDSMEKLQNFNWNNSSRTARSESQHQRLSSVPIRLEHLWVEMKN